MPGRGSHTTLSLSLRKYYTSIALSGVLRYIIILTCMLYTMGSHKPLLHFLFFFWGFFKYFSGSSSLDYLLRVGAARVDASKSVKGTGKETLELFGNVSH